MEICERLLSGTSPWYRAGCRPIQSPIASFFTSPFTSLDDRRFIAFVLELRDIRFHVLYRLIYDATALPRVFPGYARLALYRARRKAIKNGTFQLGHFYCSSAPWSEWDKTRGTFFPYKFCAYIFLLPVSDTALDTQTVLRREVF